MRTVLKRTTAAALLILLSIVAPVSVASAEPDTGNAAGTQNELSDFEKQKKISYETVPETNNIEGWPEGPKVYGNSAIVMDMDSGAVLYGKKVDEQHYPASITKLFTVLMALENSSLDDEVLFSQESIDILRWDYASIGMRAGEILSMKDALYATMLASANEAAYAVGENVGKRMGGNYDTFIQAMNDRGTELGCTGSHWMNANGLHDDQHYTTAHDMALITSELYQHTEFRTIAQTLTYTIGPTNLVNEERVFQQHHKMLWQNNSNYYEYCTGGKTGYTDDARTTLVTTADNGELRLVAVVLKDDGDVYADTRSMFDYAFENFSKVMLGGAEKPEEVKDYAESNSYVLLPEGIDFASLDYEITILDEKKAKGTVTFSYKGQNVGSAAVTLTPEYIEKETGYTTRLELNGSGMPDEPDGAERTEGFLPVSVGTASVIAVITVVLLIILTAAAVIHRRRAVRKKKRRMTPRRRRLRVHRKQAGHSRNGRNSVSGRHRRG